MERSIDEKEREMIISFGALGYAPRMMSDVLDWPIAEVTQLYANKESEFYKLYRKGKSRSDYVIDLKLFEMAQGGDLRAMKELEKRKRK